MTRIFLRQAGRLGRADGRRRREFDHIVVQYGNGESETPQVRDVIRAGGHSRAIPLAGDRIVESLELWYSKANPNSAKPEVNLWGKR